MQSVSSYIDTIPRYYCISPIRYNALKPLSLYSWVIPAEARIQNADFHQLMLSALKVDNSSTQRPEEPTSVLYGSYDLIDNVNVNRVRS